MAGRVRKGTTNRVRLPEGTCNFFDASTKTFCDAPAPKGERCAMHSVYAGTGSRVKATLKALRRKGLL